MQLAYWRSIVSNQQSLDTELVRTYTGGTSIKGVVRLIRAKKSIFSIIFFKDTINIYLFV